MDKPKLSKREEMLIKGIAKECVATYIKENKSVAIHIQENINKRARYPHIARIGDKVFTLTHRRCQFLMRHFRRNNIRLVFWHSLYRPAPVSAEWSTALQNIEPGNLPKEQGAI